MSRDVYVRRTGDAIKSVFRYGSLLAAGMLLANCGGSGASLGVGDRFSQLFGGASSNTNAQLVGTPPAPYAGGGAPQGGP